MRCSSYLAHYEKLDPNNNRTNIVAFDGAANVHKAADLIKEHFSAFAVIQGIKPTVSRIVGTWIDLHTIKDLCQIATKVSTFIDY